jgi:hypothetical protein
MACLCLGRHLCSCWARVWSQSFPAAVSVFTVCTFGAGLLVQCQGLATCSSASDLSMMLTDHALVLSSVSGSLIAHSVAPGGVLVPQ